MGADAGDQAGATGPAFPLRQAIDLLGRAPAQAETLARDRLSTHPDDPDATTVLAAALRARGALTAAEAVLAPLAARETAPWVVRYEWSQLLLARGRSREARVALERTVALNPDLGAAWRRLGDILLASGDTRAAQRAYDRLLASVVPEPRLRAAAAALAEGRLEHAVGDLRDFAAREPGSAPGAHLLGEALARSGQLAAAEALLARCVAAAPGLSLARQSYALLLLRVGKPVEALAELDRLVARDPGDARSRMAKAAALTEIGDYAGAADVTASVLEAFPDQPHAWLLHGNGLRTLGRVDEAVAAWRRCLELDPDCAEAYWSLANLKDRPLDVATRRSIEALLESQRLDAQGRSLLLFALAKALEDEGRPAESFACYARANGLQRDLRGYDAALTRARTQAAKATFTPAFFAERAGWGCPAADPIFIVGLPRSGSTLVEQILASHSDVEGTRELMDIQHMADWAAAQGSPASLSPAAVSQLGLDYLSRTRPLRRLGRSRFIDKAPWNFMHAGLIHLILPNARIVDVRRHPLACCVSAFKQHFAGGFDFAYDLADLGGYYADYVELMAHFDAAAPGLVCRVFYEALVEDTESQVRRLLDNLGLAFDPACLRFFENPRPVATPSSQQVRRPIYREATDQWRDFEPWLGPLKQALGPVLEAYPAAP